MKRLNVKLVAWLVGGLAVFCVGVHFLHGFQIDRNASSLLAQARKERESGDLNGAMKRYTQYLKHKDDKEGYEELATVVTDIAESPNATRTDLFRAFSVLEEAVRRHPDLAKVRLRLVDYTMRVGRFRDAKDHLEILRQEDHDDPTLDVKYAQCQIVTGSEDKAERLLYELVGYDDTKQEFAAEARGRHEVNAYVQLADLLRKKMENPQAANKVMSQMIKANKDSSKAYLEFARYLQRNNLDKSNTKIQENLGKALALAPEDASIVLALAESALAQKDYAKAGKLLKEGVEKAPKNEGMYRAQASLALAQNKPEEAMEYVEAGLKEVPGSQALLLVRADLQLQKNDLDGVRASIKAMREASFVHELVDYLDARIMLSEKKWRDASQSLEKLRPLMARWPELVNQIDLFLGRSYENQGQADRALEAFKRAWDNDPASLEAASGVGRSYQATGKTTEAAAVFARVQEQLGEKKISSPALTSNLLALAMSREAQKPLEERDWTEVDSYVDQIMSEETFSPEQRTVLKAEVLMAKGQPSDMDEAKKLLAAAMKKYPKELSVWLVSLNWVQRDVEADKKIKPADRADRQIERAMRMIERAEKELGDVPAMRQNRANLLARDGIKHPEEAKQGLKKLEEGLDKFTPEQQVGIWSDLGGAYYRLRDYDNTRRCWSKVAAAHKDDPKIRQTMFDLSQEFSDEEGMQKAIDEIKSTMGVHSGLYNYAMASRSIWEVRTKRKEATELAQARKYLKEGIAIRGEWHELARLEGEADELEGKTDSAITNYQRALQLGPPNASAARRLVMMLYGKGRYPEAEDAMKYVGNRDGDGMEKVRTVIKLQKNNIEGAVEDSEAAVKQDPENVDKLLFLAQIYDRAKRPEDAEKTYRSAWEKGKQIPQTWLMLVQHLAANEKKTEAEEIVGQAKDSLTPDQTEQVLAQANEMLGHRQQAEEHFLDMLKENPEDLSTIRNVAMYYIRGEQMEKAGEYVEKMLKKADKIEDKDRENIIWARRVLAKILASKGDYPNLQKAIKVIESNAVDGKLLQEDMVLASDLLANRPELPSRNAAIDMLEQLQSIRELKLEEQFVLVRLYERNGRWNEARDRMSQLLVKAEKNPTYLAQFAQMLLKHDDLENANRWVEKLEAIQPKALVTNQLRAGILVKQNKPDQAVNLLEALVPRPLSQKQLPQLAAVANALEELNQNVAAEKLLRDFYEQQPRAVLALASFLSRHGNIDECFELCGKARKSQPMGAVVQVGLSALRQRPREVTKKHVDMVDGWVTKALEEDPESVTIQLQQADLRDIQGRYEDVAKIYRSIVARTDVSEQRKAIVKNNLAFVLALADKPLGNPAEALKLTEESIKVLGPAGDLLDTRGVAQLNLGNTKQAISDIEAAIADGAGATKYLHLAMAHMAAKDKEAATQAMQEAQEFKIDPLQMSKMERKQYDLLIKLVKTK